MTKNSLLESDVDPEGKIKGARRMRRAINLAAGIILALFAWLQFSRAEVLSAVSGVPAQVVSRIALVLYYAAWVSGPKSDLDALEIILSRPPKKFGLPDFGIVALFALGFGALCWANTPQKFVIFLAVFWTIDYLGVRLRLAKLAREGADRALDAAGSDLAKIIRIRAVLDQVCGPWRWMRFYVGYLLILVLALLVFGNGAVSVARILNSLMSVSDKLVIATATLGFVLAVELWMWKHRFSRDAIMRAVEDGLVTQALTPRSSSSQV